MTEILHMVLTEFWPFFAAVVLIEVAGQAVASVVAAFRKGRDP